jgi:hypothetical protein
VVVKPGLPVAVVTALPVGVDARVPVDVACAVGDPPAGVAVLVRVGPLVVAVATGEALGDALPSTTGVAVGVGDGDSMPGGAVVVRSGVGVRVRTKNVPVAVRVGGPRRGVRVTVGVRVNSGMARAGRSNRAATLMPAKQVHRTRRQYALMVSSGSEGAGRDAQIVPPWFRRFRRHSRRCCAESFADCQARPTAPAGRNCRSKGGPRRCRAQEHDRVVSRPSRVA